MNDQTKVRARILSDFRQKFTSAAMPRRAKRRDSQLMVARALAIRRRTQSPPLDSADTARDVDDDGSHADENPSPAAASSGSVAFSEHDLGTNSMYTSSQTVASGASVACECMAPRARAF